MNEENYKCTLCLYVVILSIAAIASTYWLPLYDRELVREYTGTITAAGSTAGGLLCAYFVYIMSRGKSALNRRLQEVYFLMLVIFTCTAAFGVLGTMHPAPEDWDIVYNIRAVAIVLEVVALFRFFLIWWKVGHK